MDTFIWCLLGSILLISVNAQINDYIPHSFHEKPLASSPSPIPSQTPPPDLIGMKEVVLFLTPDQVGILQGAGAVVQPYPEHASGYDELQQQYQQSIQQQNEETATQNESPKLNSYIRNYHKLLNIQQINDELAQPRTTESTIIKITTTPRYEITTSQHYYKDQQHFAPNGPKKVSKTKFSISNKNISMEYVPFPPKNENDSLKMVPYDGLPLNPYGFDKVQTNIYTQNNDQVIQNAQAIHKIRHNVNIQSSNVNQRNIYSRVNQEPQSTKYVSRKKEPQLDVYSLPIDEVEKSVSSKEAQSNAFIQPLKDFQQTKYTLTNIDDQRHVSIKPADEVQQKPYRQLNKNSRRNKQTQANKEAQRIYMNTKTINEDQQRTYNQENGEAEHNSYKFDNTKFISYSKAINDAQKKLETIEDNQKIPYITQKNEKAQQNAYYILENEKAQPNRFKPAQLTIKEEFENPQQIVTVLRPQFKQNAATILTHLGATVTTGLKNTFKYVQDLQSRFKQKKQEISQYREKLSLLLAPLYQHHTITDLISRQREKLLNNEFKFQTKLQQTEHEPQEDHQELENLIRILGKPNALAEIKTIPQSPTVDRKQETEENPPTEHVNNKFPIFSASYPAPLQSIRTIPLPVLQTQNNEAEKPAYTVNRNDHIKEDIENNAPVAIRLKMPFDNIPIPEHVTILRPLWEH